MKIKKTISLIEFLSSNEIKKLITYLNEEIDLNQYSPKIQKLIERRDVEKIAWMIEKGELKETKEILMIQNNYGWSVAHQLAYNSGKVKWNINDKDILMLQDNNGWSVAHYLAYHSNKTNWTTNDKEILMIQNNYGQSVAHWLAYNSFNTKWYTNDKDVLMLQDNNGWSVAHYLAENHPTWTTRDPYILNLKNNNKITVEDILKQIKKI